MKKTITESRLNQIIAESVKKVLKEHSLDNEKETIDFYDFVDVLEKCGWSYFNSCEVVSKKTGAKGVRFDVEANSKKACPFDELMQKVQAAAYIPEKVVASWSTYRYAPEIKHYAIIILY